MIFEELGSMGTTVPPPPLGQYDICFLHLPHCLVFDTFIAVEGDSAFDLSMGLSSSDSEFKHSSRNEDMFGDTNKVSLYEDTGVDGSSKYMSNINLLRMTTYKFHYVKVPLGSNGWVLMSFY